MHGIYVHLTHTGATPAELRLQDVYPTTDGHTAYRRAGPVYVPANGAVDLIYTSEVAASLESGTIRGYVNLGYLKVEIRFGDEVEGIRKWGGGVPNTGVLTEIPLNEEQGKRLILPDNTACQYEVRIVALDMGDATQVAWWDVTGGIVRAAGAASTTLVGANIGFTQNAGGNSALWTTSLDADAVNGALVLNGTVPAAVGDVKFAATGHITFVSF